MAWFAVRGEVAKETGRKIHGHKPGRTVRTVYWLGYVKAKELGYNGNEDDWKIFVRVRG